MKKTHPRLTMPSNGGLSNPILENFKFEREAARREAAQKKDVTK